MIKNFLKQIRQVRVKRGYSQEATSFELNISQNAYSKIESGKSKLRLDTVLKLSKVFNLKIVLENGTLVVLENETKKPTNPTKVMKEIRKIKHHISKLVEPEELPTN